MKFQVAVTWYNNYANRLIMSKGVFTAYARLIEIQDCGLGYFTGGKRYKSRVEQRLQKSRGACVLSPAKEEKPVTEVQRPFAMVAMGAFYPPTLMLLTLPGLTPLIHTLTGSPKAFQRPNRCLKSILIRRAQPGGSSSHRSFTLF